MCLGHVDSLCNRLLFPSKLIIHSPDYFMSAQQDVVNVRIPAHDVPPLWSGDNVTGKMSGFLPDILEELFKVVKLNYTITCAQGSYSDLGNQSTRHRSLLTYSLVDSLARKEFDLLIADLTMNTERVDKIDFTVPFQTADIIIIYRRSSQLNSDYLAVFQPLSAASWLAIFGAMTLGSIFSKLSSSILNFL